MNRQAFDEHSSRRKTKFINFLFENSKIQQVTYNKTVICFLLICLTFASLSIFFFIEVSKVVQVKQLYYSPYQTTHCTSYLDICNITIQVTKQMEAPIYVMYQLGNFYQNNRRYIISKSNKQLAGNEIELNDAGICYPYITNKDMRATKSWNGTLLDPNATASPCGSIAYTFFNDTYQLYYNNDTKIIIDETGISWTGDKGKKFKKTPNSSQTQWIDPENQHFIVWMRTSGLPNFKKPWGIIDQNLPIGTYKVKIANNYKPNNMQGNRFLILTTLSLVGGNNYLLPSTFAVIALLSFIAMIYFCRRFRSIKSISQNDNQ